MQRWLDNLEGLGLEHVERKMEWLWESEEGETRKEMLVSTPLQMWDNVNLV